MSTNDTPAWPTSQWFIESDGQITLGRVGPVPCAAVAASDGEMHVALVRRNDESLSDLLTRLDASLRDALDNETPIDEINR